ncbi:unnamed protein product [Moneuplotes crassus]|uniref:Uncharacterized protein n=1 Tax=Euplotes crassus TaxID=5936 RepID=A0AAD1UHD2_EUPCR|nr:unnamed protein product [Moneuplotes crassus]
MSSSTDTSPIVINKEIYTKFPAGEIVPIKRKVKGVDGTRLMNEFILSKEGIMHKDFMKLSLIPKRKRKKAKATCKAQVRTRSQSVLIPSKTPMAKSQNSELLQKNYKVPIKRGILNPNNNSGEDKNEQLRQEYFKMRRAKIIKRFIEQKIFQKGITSCIEGKLSLKRKTSADTRNRQCLDEKHDDMNRSQIITALDRSRYKSPINAKYFHKALKYLYKPKYG